MAKRTLAISCLEKRKNRDFLPDKPLLKEWNNGQ